MAAPRRDGAFYELNIQHSTFNIQRSTSIARGATARIFTDAPFNPGAEAVEESILVPDSKLMNDTKFVDLLGSEQIFKLTSGVLRVWLAPKSALVLQPQTQPVDGYTPYKRFA